MDPQKAYDLFSVAATRTVPLSTGRVCFSDITDSHSAEIRAGKSRTFAIALAKKYLKACEVLEELEKGLETSPHADRLFRVPPVYANKKQAMSPGPRSCAIVPFFKTTPLQQPLTFVNENRITCPSPSTMLDRAVSTVKCCLESRAYQHYRFACQAIFLFLLYLPIFVLFSFCVFLILASLYLAFHPVALGKLALHGILRLIHAGMAHTAVENNFGGAHVGDSWISTWF